MNFGVEYQPSGSFRECASAAQARQVFEHAPVAPGETAILVIDGARTGDEYYSPEEQAPPAARRHGV